MAKFANTLFTRMSAVKPAVKFRYLQGRLRDRRRPQAWPSRPARSSTTTRTSSPRSSWTTAIDGSDVVGHEQPFGVFVNLRHTREIERESGGFGRYLQNQNSSCYFSYNYGRPTADYRDNFQAAATEALKEHFEVLSVTFQTDKVNSRGRCRSTAGASRPTPTCC